MQGFDSDSDSDYSPAANVKTITLEANKDDGKIYIDTLSHASVYNYSGMFKETFDKFIKDLPEDKTKDIKIVLNTTGGSIFYAMLIAQNILSRTGKTTAIVPEMATCAGTLIALACDEIHMSPSACLGRITQWSASKTSEKILPALLNWREKSFWADLGYQYYKDDVDADTQAILKLLSTKHTDDEVAQLEAQFMSERSSSMPMFAKDLMHLPCKIVIDEELKPKAEVDKKAPSRGGGVINSLMRTFGM